MGSTNLWGEVRFQEWPPAPLENKKIEGKLYFSYNIYEMSFSVLDLWHR